MLKILPESKHSFYDVKRINDDAFKREDEGRLIEALRSTVGFIPELSLLAYENSLPVGHILFSKIKIETQSSVIETLALAPMAVIAKQQKQGIGSQLVLEGLRLAKELGFNGVIVLGHPQYYPRFGFEPASKFGIKPPFECPDEVFMALELQSGAFANVAGTVRYPIEFNEV